MKRVFPRSKFPRALRALENFRALSARPLLSCFRLCLFDSSCPPYCLTAWLSVGAQRARPLLSCFPLSFGFLLSALLSDCLAVWLPRCIAGKRRHKEPSKKCQQKRATKRSNKIEQQKRATKTKNKVFSPDFWQGHAHPAKHRYHNMIIGLKIW